MVASLRRDTQARIVEIDGWTALPAYVPPRERRGLVLIDPPFEERNEFDRLSRGFAAAFAKWPRGIYLMWYPAKSRRSTDDLARDVGAAAGEHAAGDKVLRIEFSVAPQSPDGPLTSAGLLVVNPPWTLATEMKTILSELVRPLGQGGAGRYRVETLRA